MDNLLRWDLEVPPGTVGDRPMDLNYEFRLEYARDLPQPRFASGGLGEDPIGMGGMGGGMGGMGGGFERSSGLLRPPVGCGGGPPSHDEHGPSATHHFHLRAPVDEAPFRGRLVGRAVESHLARRA